MTLSNSKYADDKDPNAYQISLLEEKLRVARHKEKTGEVIIRKEVETRMVRLPIRREKLVVERVGKHPELLTEIIVSEETVNGYKYSEIENDDRLDVVQSHFVSLSTAQKILAEIARLNLNNSKIRLEIVTNSDAGELPSRINAITREQ